MEDSENKPLDGWKGRLHEIIYEADTPAGKFFDMALIVCIVLSVGAVMLDSVKGISQDYGNILWTAELAFTVIFTIEYILRIVCIRKPTGYIFSFFGVIDFLSILPTYLMLFVTEEQLAALLIIRTLRVLRVFRVLKLTPYLSEANVLSMALAASRRKVLVFFSSVIVLAVILGALMYLIEGNRDGSGFTSIPKSIYWAIVTITTVGYGDISPTTPFGQFIASFVMMIGYAIIAVPTGIVTVELNEAMHKMRNTNTQVCSNCAADNHQDDASFCRQCGSKL